MLQPKKTILLIGICFANAEDFVQGYFLNPIAYLGRLFLKGISSIRSFAVRDSGNVPRHKPRGTQAYRGSSDPHGTSTGGGSSSTRAHKISQQSGQAASGAGVACFHGLRDCAILKQHIKFSKSN